MLKTSSGRTVIPNDAELRKDILDDAHQTRYTVHLGNNKQVCAQSVNKNNNAEIKRHRDFC